MKYKNLLHLNESQVKELVKRYYAGENVQRLLDDYSLQVFPSRLYTLLPPMEFTDDGFQCEYCGSNLIAENLSKAAFRDIYCGYDRDKLFCPQCSHRPFDAKCNCPACIKKREKKVAQRRAKISEKYSTKARVKDFLKLAFRDKVFLGAVCDSMLSDDTSVILSLEDLDELSPLAPTEQFSLNIIETLLQSQLIKISLSSPIDAFEWDSGESLVEYNLQKLNFLLNVDYDGQVNACVEKMHHADFFDADSADELEVAAAIALWKELAVEECYQYLVFQLKELRLNHTPQKRCRMVFRKILENFSIQEIYYFIWKQLQYISLKLRQRQITEKHAVNYIVPGCERYAELVLEHEWQTRKLVRPKDLPFSVMTDYLFNKVLKIGESTGFGCPPNIKYLLESD
ncbi:hypothetical protein [uncultured Cloacibacillus sp.]|uniref:hypothetical protein n=1 Tax=uncultured Cloacibacillus sp. TaxID=889794 RepID=UPI003207F4A5